MTIGVMLLMLLKHLGLVYQMTGEKDLQHMSDLLQLLCENTFLPILTPRNLIHNLIVC